MSESTKICFTELNMNISQRFVEGILGYYYKSDGEVEKDTELQQWIQDIFEHGFLSQASSGGLKRKVQSCW